jgi:ribonucleoside-diphosphate reductase alpha chain
MDYVFRYLGNRFLKSDVEEESEEQREDGSLETMALRSVVAGGSGERAPSQPRAFINQADAPSCHNCGSIMIRSGACYKCFNCGETSGCS